MIFPIFLGVQVARILKRKQWSCGSKHNAGKPYATPFECAKKCRTIYTREEYFQWGFIGGGRSTECICEKSSACATTGYESHSGFNIYKMAEAGNFSSSFSQKFPYFLSRLKRTSCGKKQGMGLRN